MCRSTYNGMCDTPSVNVIQLILTVSWRSNFAEAILKIAYGVDVVDAHDETVEVINEGVAGVRELLVFGGASLSTIFLSCVMFHRISQAVVS